jgi:nitrate reductase delta subunit
VSYPDQDLVGRIPLLRAAASTLPGPLGMPLRAFLDHLEVTPLGDVAAAYVATFDHRRRCSPYLTYFAYGDTRRRGMALLRFTHTFRAAGLILGPGELPDHLAVVLEFAATDAAAGRRLLTEHRAGLELMRASLHEDGSPWARVLDSVSATLPPLGRRERDTVRRLAAEGPPEEEVGLAPFAPPEYMPEPLGGRR